MCRRARVAAAPARHARVIEVVEQRTRLALDANAADRVADALDALTIAPDKTIKDSSHYLALRTAYYRIVRAHGDEDLKDVVAYLWTVALAIEDGDLSLTAQSLRDAQEALRKALENNASDKEIQRLTEELRKAMQETQASLRELVRGGTPPEPSTTPAPHVPPTEPGPPSPHDDDTGR